MSKKRARNGYRSSTGNGGDPRSGGFKRSKRRPKYDRNLLPAEEKFFDTEILDDNFTTAWVGGEMEDATVLSISAIAQGDGESTRDGRRYKILSAHLRGEVEVPSIEAQGTVHPDVICKIAMVLDKQTCNAQLNAEDVYQDNASASSVYSMREMAFTKRFQVLRQLTLRIPVGDATLNEGAVNSFANANVRIPFAIDYKFKKPIVVTCSLTTGVIAAVVDQSIHVIGCATSTTAQLSYKSRVRFVG